MADAALPAFARAVTLPMHRCVRLLTVLALLAGAVTVAGSERTFFTVARIGGAWWFVDPDGRRFLSRGVVTVDEGIEPHEWSLESPGYSASRSYETLRAWGDHALERLARWGFNTIGAWSSDSLYARGTMPFTVCLHVGSAAGVPWVDLWDPAVEQLIADLADDAVKPWRRERRLIGYFYDNELPWWDETLFAHFMNLPWRERADAAEDGAWRYNRTKLKLLDLIRRQYGPALRGFADDWVLPRDVRSIHDLREPVVVRRRPGRRPAVVDAFLDVVYGRYQELVTRAMRRADPDHLLLGERYAQFYSARQAVVSGRWNDVVSLNVGAWTMDGWVSPNWLRSMTRLSGRPVLVSEFYFAAMENSSRSRNTGGRFPTVPTQRERVAGYLAQVRQMAALPEVVGWHWFQYYDEPPQGRGDGEDYNMGLVDIENREYAELVSASALVNAEVDALHERSGRDVPGSREAPAFRVPAARRAPVVDGELMDWDKASAWLPGTGGRPLDAPIGDFFLSTTPGYLHVALIYQPLYRDPEFVLPLEPGARWPAEECERLTIALATPSGAPLATVVLRQEPDSTSWIVEAGSDPARVQVGAGRALEVSIPIPALTSARFAAELRSVADAQVLYWGGRPLSENPRPAGWGTLVLSDTSVQPADSR